MPTRICKFCNKSFISKKGTKYCSDKCRNQKRLKNPFPKCKNCNKEFVKKTIRQVLCSEKCRKENTKKWNYNRNRSQKYKTQKKVWRKNDKWQSSEKGKEWWREYRKKHKQLFAARSNEWKKKQLKTNSMYRLTERIRGQLNQAIRRKNFSKSKNTIQYLGIKTKYLKKYLEHKFQPGMSWENYGKVWHIDHIIPISVVDTSKEENIKFVFHYRNLQPMFAKDNMRKSNKVWVPAEKGDKLRDMDVKINKILKRIHPEQELDFNIITTPIDERGRGVEIILKRTID